ncbi:MAG: ATPase, T2SS/T4P/T4SS family, partial [Planctomycetota bacterium]
RDEAENTVRLTAAKALPGFEEFRRQMWAAVVARSTTMVVEVGAETTVRHEVDGVWGKPRVRKPPRSRKEKEAWVEVPPSSRDVGEAVVGAAQALCGALPAAGGRFSIKVDGKPQTCRVSAAKTGDARQLAIQIEAPAAAFKTLPALGMPEPMATRLGELLAAERGLILVSSPAGSGLSTTFDLVVESGDRMLRDFISIEDAARPPREIQNVKPVRFDGRTGVTPLAALTDALREYPAVIVARDVRDKELVVELVRLVGEGKLVVMSLKASDAVEAVARVLACGVDPKALGASLLGSVSQRLVRRLCPKCREELPPPEPLLARMKLTAEQLPTIFKASAAGCRLCQGVGYIGRTGLFELASGGTLRRLVAAGATPEQLRQGAVKEGMQPLRDAGMQLVVAGATSLEEIQRALTGKPATTPVPQPAAAPARPGPAAAAAARKKP